MVASGPLLRPVPGQPTGGPVARSLALLAPWRVGAAREVPVVAAGLVLLLLALRARAADTGSMHPVSA